MPFLVSASPDFKCKQAGSQAEPARPRLVWAARVGGGGFSGVLAVLGDKTEL